MLPKVASQLLHHASRAAASAQNYTVRNVLNFQSQSSTASSTVGSWTSAGSSSWGSYGAGPGGAKYNAGSRFYNGYTGAGRAVTQANSSTAQDIGANQGDDSDELSLRPFHTRPYSRPLRPRTLTPLRPRSSSLSVPSLNVSVNDPASTPAPTRGTLVRRNSTTSSPQQDDQEDLLPIKSIESIQDFSLDPAAPQTVLPPNSHSQSDQASSSLAVTLRTRLRQARETKDFAVLSKEVIEFRRDYPQATTNEYNIALHALGAYRPSGSPINLILETYNEMLTRNLTPNARTYSILIHTLCERDKEVHKVIAELEHRMKRRDLLQRSTMAQDTDEQLLSQLKEEDNFRSAITLFQVMINLADADFPLDKELYSKLLYSCSARADIDSALKVFSHLEKSRVVPNIESMYHLLNTYINANDMTGAEDIFGELRSAARQGRIDWETSTSDPSFKFLSDGTLSGRSRLYHMDAWNKMISGYFRVKQPEKAVSMFEDMINNNSGLFFGPADVPPPCSATYSSFIRGFILLDDMQSALSWFDRMLTHATPAPAEHHRPSLNPLRPDQYAWYEMITALVERKMVDDLNRLFRAYLSVAPRDNIEVRAVHRAAVFEVNLEYLRSNPEVPREKAVSIAKFLMDGVLVYGPAPGQLDISMGSVKSMTGDFLSLLSQLEMYDDALGWLETFLKEHVAYMERVAQGGGEDQRAILYQTKGLHVMIQSIAPMLLFKKATPVAERQVPLEYTLRIGDIYMDNKIPISAYTSPQFIQSFYEAKQVNGVPTNLSAQQWDTLLSAALNIDSHPSGDENSPEGFIFQGLKAFITDMAVAIPDPDVLPSGSIKSSFSKLYSAMTLDELMTLLSGLGGRWLESFQKYEPELTHAKAVRQLELPSQTSQSPPVKQIDLHLSREINEWFPSGRKVSLETCLERYKASAAQGVYPSPEALSRLIAAFGRKGDVPTVMSLYHDAQKILATLRHDKRWQTVAWYLVEDNMIIGLAHAGKVDEAHVHRQNLLDNGSAPTSEAYGSLIQAVKETTDDSATALQLWNESQAWSVKPSVFMYNTMISKLSKARKADFALELFQQMKDNGLQPSSVSYGAIIAACTRVGDVQSAEALFSEMVTQPNFRPRPPPYNTMIQMYTSVKPDRERALHYYNQLQVAGLRPTSHTYKLLLESFGTTEPVDVDSMQSIFEELVRDPQVDVMGVHWAALINTYGCVNKDLDTAMKVFDSIATHPSTQLSGFPLPDAVAFEAMFNVLVTLRRPDLIPAYLDRLRTSRIQTTAYIANLLIKAYAADNNMDKAREVFESMEDPPVGVAAPFNHAPHTLSKSQSAPGQPVYREPSTWEAMVRAELGSGNRSKADELLERMKFRQFPQAVFHHVSTIMHDGPIVQP